MIDFREDNAKTTNRKIDNKYIPRKYARDNTLL